MKICTYCGQENPDAAEVCYIDQQPLASPEELSQARAQPPPLKKTEDDEDESIPLDAIGPLPSAIPAREHWPNLQILPEPEASEEEEKIEPTRGLETFFAAGFGVFAMLFWVIFVVSLLVRQGRYDLNVPSHIKWTIVLMTVGGALTCLGLSSATDVHFLIKKSDRAIYHHAQVFRFKKVTRLCPGSRIAALGVQPRLNRNKTWSYRIIVITRKRRIFPVSGSVCVASYAALGPSYGELRMLNRLYQTAMELASVLRCPYFQSPQGRALKIRWGADGKPRICSVAKIS